MAEIPDVLELVKGSTKPFDVFLFDERDEKEDVSVYDRATLSIREDEAGSNLLLRQTTDATLSIDVPNAKLTATLTQVEADALTAGMVCIADVALRETSTGKWRHADRFYVRIVNSFAPHP